MISGLGYLGLSAPDLSAWQAFATDVLGAEAVVRDDLLRVRIDRWSWRIEVAVGEPELRFVGWQVADDVALGRVVAALNAAGIETTAAPDLAADRGVAGLVQCCDPAGTPLEFFHSPAVAPVPFRSPVGTTFVTGDLGLGHVVVGTDRPAELQAFYRDVLGFRATDSFGKTLFMRVNQRHHSLAIGYLAQASYEIRHFMLEYDGLPSVGRALDAAFGSSECRVTRSLGQHSNDQMISFYVDSPSGVAVEIGCGGLLVDDDVWTTATYGTATDWGHRAVSTE